MARRGDRRAGATSTRPGERGRRRRTLTALARTPVGGRLEHDRADARATSEPPRARAEPASDRRSTEVDAGGRVLEELDDRPVERARRGLRARPRPAAPRARRRRRARRPRRLSDRAAATSAAGRRAGPPRAGPLARARQRAGRRRPGQGRRGASPRSRRPAVTTDVAIVVRRRPRPPDYVSRGGHKLAGALEAFGRSGSSSRAGAAWTPARRPAASPTCCCAPAPREVVAVDVGYGQLAWSLQQRRAGAACTTAPTSASSTPELIGGPVDLVVGDLSFISLDAGARRAARRDRATTATWC